MVIICTENLEVQKPGRNQGLPVHSILKLELKANKKLNCQFTTVITKLDVLHDRTIMCMLTWKVWKTEMSEGLWGCELELQ